ncbi:tectonic-3 [Rhinophrynus dorsalis]
MAAVVLCLLLILGAGTGVVRSASGVAICTCDLSPGICDLNCCCDPDCFLSDPTTVFAYCLPGSTKVQRWVCLYSWLMFRSNTPYPTKNVSSSSPRTPDLFCVLPSDPTLNYFITPRTVNGPSFSSLSDQYKGASFFPPSDSNPVIPNFYRAGDSIFTVSSSGTLGMLRQPASVGDPSVCSFNNPARFLQSDTTSCLRMISNLNEICLTDPTLSTAYYYQNISLLGVQANATALTIPNVPIISLVTDKPTLRGDSCDNVVSEVIYTVLYNGTLGIKNVTVNFTLHNMSITSVSLKQSFTVLYKSVSSADVGSVQTRSGNPGYLVGSAVLTNTGSLTVLSSAGGSCSRSPVQFGVNMLSGCTIRGQASDLCSTFRDQAYRLLLGERAPQKVAAFGNTVSAQSGDWMSIIYQNCSGAQSQANCSSCLLPTTLHVQILQAKVGLLSNPQSQIVGARFLISCKQVKCQDSTVLQTQVSFTDVTRRGPAPRSTPSVTGRAPLGFFYPFQTSAASGMVSSPLLVLSLLSFILSVYGQMHTDMITAGAS